MAHVKKLFSTGKMMGKRLVDKYHVQIVKQNKTKQKRKGHLHKGSTKVVLR